MPVSQQALLTALREPAVATDGSPRVWNMHRDAGPYPADAVYVGCRLPWDRRTWVPTNRFGNPHRVPKPGKRYRVPKPATVEQAIAWYERDLLALLARDPHWLDELRGRHLLCWCAPLPCHADVLLRLANRPVRVELASEGSVR